MSVVLGIDDGTTAVKVVAYDLGLEPVATARRSVATSHPAPGLVEQDPEEVLEAIVDAVAEVLAAIGDEEVVACGLDHQGESVLAWDPASGAPLSPILVWQDKRNSAVLDGLDLSRTGLPADPYFSAPKLSWLADRVPGTARLGTVDAFLCDRLGAGHATDPSTASRTLLQALGTSGWDLELCARFGLDPAALPVVADTVGELGGLRHERWDRELPLRARVCDQQAALAGAGCIEPGMAKATYGTGVFVLAHAGDAPPSRPGLLPTVAWSRAGRVEYALDGGVFTAGAFLDQLASLGLTGTAAELGPLAATVHDAGGVMMLPALAGLGAPHWRPEATARIEGITGATTRAHLARAALEAIAHRTADIVEAMGDVTELRVDGGLTNDDTLVQLQADLLGLPLLRLDADATARGAAALALDGAGIAPLGSLPPSARRVEPARDGSWREGERSAWRAFVAR